MKCLARSLSIEKEAQSSDMDTSSHAVLPWSWIEMPRERMVAYMALLRSPSFFLEFILTNTFCIFYLSLEFKFSLPSMFSHQHFGYRGSTVGFFSWIEYKGSSCLR
jgi:hypothetical protein